MKKISLIFAGIIVLALLLMGVLEKALSETVGSAGVVIMYAIVAGILLILYRKASKEAAAEKEERGKRGEPDPEELYKNGELYFRNDFPRDDKEDKL